MRREITENIDEIIKNCANQIAVETVRLQDLNLELQPGRAHISEKDLIRNGRLCPRRCKE